MQFLHLVRIASVLLTPSLVKSCKQRRHGQRIVGGTEMHELVPYQVSLQAMTEKGRWHHFCSGSIISSTFVITAAHCLSATYKKRILSALAGTLKWKEGGERRRIIARFPHPYFMAEKRGNDIGLVKVDPPFNLHKGKIEKVFLGDETPIGDGVPVRLTGWGTTNTKVKNDNEKGRLSDNMQVLSYKTITNEQCDSYFLTTIRSTQICASFGKGKGACKGDSGGPLVLADSRNNQLVGIVSVGNKNCEQNKADIYTRVSSYLPFISKILNDDIFYGMRRSD